jgi:hypothetical protein
VRPALWLGPELLVIWPGPDCQLINLHQVSNAICAICAGCPPSHAARRLLQTSPLHRLLAGSSSNHGKRVPRRWGPPERAEIREAMARTMNCTSGPSAVSSTPTRLHRHRHNPNPSFPPARICQQRPHINRAATKEYRLARQTGRQAALPHLTCHPAYPFHPSSPQTRQHNSNCPPEVIRRRPGQRIGAQLLTRTANRAGCAVAV